MRRFLVLIALVLSSSLVAAPALAKKGKAAEWAAEKSKKEGKKKKKKKGEEEAPPAVGPVQVGKFTCYAPPNWAAMTESQRRIARSEALEHLMGLVQGKVNDGFAIKNEQDLTYFETAFYGRPQLLDDWAEDNWKRCKAVGEGKAKPSAYLSWISAQGAELEAGECYKPLDYEYHNFMEIQAGWQLRVHVCSGDKFLVEATGEENGKYTVADTGKYKDNVYVTATGQPVLAGKYDGMSELPADVVAVPAGDLGLVPEEPLGALVMRFESEDGSYTKYFLVGQELEFEAPDHGFVSFAVNDTVYYDNRFHDIRGAIDYLGLDIYPPKNDTTRGGATP